MKKRFSTLIAGITFILLTAGCSFYFIEEERKIAKPKKIEYVEYKGKVEHLFFHPLIAYPKRAFKGDSQSEQIDMWFNTVPEFNRIIESLYKKNFILVHIHDVYEEVEENGQKKIKRKKLMLPKGKKPIILSIDDLSYYTSDQIKYGTNLKLVLHRGEIATLSINDQGKKVIRRDNEIVPLLDDFVKKHPDFSYKGAKGTINLTGFDGILGYRTNSKKFNETTNRYDIENPHFLKERGAVKPIIKRLKETGWKFASHSYYHLPHNQISLEKLKEDSRLWKEEVESLIGPTDIYVFPQGFTFPYESVESPYIQHLYHMGFRYFQPVGHETYVEHLGKVIFQDRRHADGLGLRLQKKYFLDLFDADQVIDRQNRPAHVKYVEEILEKQKKKQNQQTENNNSNEMNQTESGSTTSYHSRTPHSGVLFHSFMNQHKKTLHKQPIVM
ncbi:polysaccharide deacetylase family protein [Thermoflavimicrobium dichotomicum]|uniref:NodB homology domain-containing protein n=1 Tax=Thermoflavimicrobium dichotomicum TaxID=46223 RepID=A0A1I3R6R8_9BACL|nr:polysaccharide deacetylase family protein [Thermoflavimicrobium dichotomicum]SFJ41815.1 hypothetical protein SAMN05421852_10941 [Thermoflavimicrobium dichotomicum]